jgi:hypothetical protein
LIRAPIRANFVCKLLVSIAVPPWEKRHEACGSGSRYPE